VFALPPLAAFSVLPAAELGPGVAAAAGVLGLLGAVALFLAKRKARPSRLLQIVETASLGPKRSLIVARVGSETLILGASEAGIALLGRRNGNVVAGDRISPMPEGAAAPAAARSAGVAGREERHGPAPSGPAPSGPAPVGPAPGSAPGPIAVDPPVAHAPVAPRFPPAPPPAADAPAGILGRLRLVKQRAPAPSFEPLLRQSLEDQELRAKVAAGGRRAAP
jgi:hypothetical protein